jgi:hypothetical protein
MADSKESFETLEDGSGNGVAATSAQIGEAGAAKIGMAVFPFVDASGVLRQPRVNASNDLMTDGSAYTQPVSGPLTDTQLRASAVPTSAAQSGAWNINNLSGTVSLPTGASTLAEQQAQTTSLGTINTSVNTLLKPASTLSAVTTVGTVSSVTAIANALPTGTNSIGQVTANAGANLNTSALALETTQATQNTRIGDLTETAPVSDTASSGLNGRLQRIAQRITSLISTVATEVTLALINGKLNSLTTAPGASAAGLVVRPVSLELPTFNITAENIVVGNNKSMLALQNTGTSVVTIREIWITNDQTTAVTGVAGEFRVHRINSFTGGTELTPTSFDTSDSLPAGITSAHASTVSGEGVLFRNGKWSTDEWGTGTADVEAFDHAIQNTAPFWRQTQNGKGLVIRQNQGMHIRFATNSTAGSFNIRLVFTTG